MIKNLIDALISCAEDEGKGIRYILGSKNEKYISYKELYSIAKGILFNLQKKGLKQDNEIILHIEESEIDKFTHIFWAALLGGSIPVPVSQKKNSEVVKKLLNIWSVMINPFLVTTREQMNYINDYIKNNNLGEIYDEISDKAIYIDELMNITDEGIIYTPKKNDIAFIQFSSGSTGQPKGVVLTHENLLTNTKAIIKSSNIRENDSMLNWMPLTHDMGLIGFHLTPIVGKINQTLMPTQLFIRRPYLWLKKASEYKATVLASPNFGYKYFLKRLNREKYVDLDLSNVRIIYNGAEPINISICNEFLCIMEKYNLKKEAILPVYGLAEASVAVSIPTPNEIYTHHVVDRRHLGVGEEIQFLEGMDDERAIIFVGVGCPIEKCFVRICDDEDNRLEEKIIGNIHIKGDNVTTGYYNNDEATAMIKTDDGWTRTGDLGLMINDQLIITGRKKDVIFVQAQNYYSHDIERVVIELEDISDGEVVACGIEGKGDTEEKLVIFKLNRKEINEFNEIAGRIKNQVVSKMGLLVEQVVPVKRIPKTTSGKVQRYILKEKYLNDEFLETINEMMRLQNEKSKETSSKEAALTDTENKLKDICTEILRINQIGIHDNLIHKGINSLILTKIYEQINLEYPDRIKISDLYTYPSIGELARFIDEDTDFYIPSMILSDEYFKGFSKSNNKTTFEIEFKGKEYYDFKKIVLEEDITIYDMLVSLYLYLFAKLSDGTAVVQVAMNAKGDISTLDVNLEKLKYMKDLMRIVREKMCKDSELNTYKLKNIVHKNISKLENAVIPIVYKKKYISNGINLMNIFDIGLQVENSSESINFVWEYNHKRINKSSVKEIANIYMNILDTIIKTYEYH